MELSEFVSGSLNGVIKGIKDAQLEAKKHGAIVSPKVIRKNAEQILVAHRDANEPPNNPVQLVEFDVAVTAEASAEATAGVGGILAVLTVAGKVEGTKAHSEVSRLRFTIPVVWPTQ